MGFFVMLFAAIIGIALLVVGIGKSRKDRRWIGAIVLGLVSFLFAAWLGWPK